jgi:ATP-binding protein involved in chromosome partitioning
MHPSFLRVLNQKKEIKEKLSGIKHKIGIYSAKGGVGKTTVAVNLAFALKSLGYKVGLLDADVDTPNLNLFLGIRGTVEANYPLKPIDKDGVKVLSTAMFVDEETKPIIWRGPMIGKMIGEFFGNTEWGELDYLILDLSPGTSDAPLSIMQLLDMDGFILVTTPQRIAAVNAIRSGRMIKRMGISIIGVLENMSDGSAKGGKEVAEALECELLGTINENREIGELSDEGVVPVLANSSFMDQFVSIARRFSGS